VRRGQAAGIIVIFATQRPDAKAYPPAFLGRSVGFAEVTRGGRHTASITYLHRIAVAGRGHCRTARKAPHDAVCGAGRGRGGHAPGTDLRRRPAADDGSEEPLSIGEAERTVDYLWGVYWAGRYQLLSQALPHSLSPVARYLPLGDHRSRATAHRVAERLEADPVQPQSAGRRSRLHFDIARAYTRRKVRGTR
jgi:hypothetical protein